MSREINTSAAGKVDLSNADAASGTNLANIQRELNSIASFTGKAVNQPKDAKPSWASDSIGSPNQNEKNRIDSVQAVVETNQTAVARSLVWDLAITKSFSDLAAAATTNDIELFELPAKSVIQYIVLKHTTAFSGGSISAYTLSLGISGVLDKYLLPFDVFQAVGDTVFDTVSLFALENFGAVTSIRLAAISTGDNLDQAAAGSVDVFLQRSLLP